MLQTKQFPKHKAGTKVSGLRLGREKFWDRGCGDSGSGGDLLLGAGVVCDLLYNLAIAFVSHDLMISAKL